VRIEECKGKCLDLPVKVASDPVENGLFQINGKIGTQVTEDILEHHEHQENHAESHQPLHGRTRIYELFEMRHHCILGPFNRFRQRYPVGLFLLCTDNGITLITEQDMQKRGYKCKGNPAQRSKDCRADEKNDDPFPEG